ncbi:MAG: 50S ribosomal protein L19 [Candidatus Sungbacteria bacterium]|nr:50S ribosomal protein L19 [Candidatus Sungbacteria bacterium]
MDTLALFAQKFTKKIPAMSPGDTVKVYQKLKEGDKMRVQPFEGILIARKHGKGVSATITVRKVSAGIGIEKVIPLHSPTIEKIEIVKKANVRRAKLYYIRHKAAREVRRKMKAIIGGRDVEVIEETKAE